MRGDCFCRDLELVGLGFVRVGDPAVGESFAGAWDVGEAVGDESASAAFCGGELQAFFPEKANDGCLRVRSRRR